MDDLVGAVVLPGIPSAPVVHDFIDEHSLRGSTFTLAEWHPKIAENLHLGLVPQDLGINQETIHVEERRAYCHPATFPHVDYYGVMVRRVRPLENADVERVVERITTRLAEDATVQPLVNPALPVELLADALRNARHETWVCEEDGVVVGHLYGAMLENATYGNGVWIGPDGVSFNTTDILADLYATAGATWLEHAALEHYVWTLDDVVSVEPWYELGFARMHMRGVLALREPRAREFPSGYLIRRGDVDDIDTAVALDDELDAVQRVGPSFSIGLDHSTKRDDLLETLGDPDTNHYIVEANGRAVAQCLTFALPPRRGSFDHTLHLSAVTVDAEHRHHGVGTAMVDWALREAFHAGFQYVETNWRVTNRRAGTYWRHYGFVPTYVRLHRTIGTG